MEYHALAIGIVSVASIVTTATANKLVNDRNKEFYRGLAQAFGIEQYKK